MPELTRSDLDAAALRLRGQVVQTPIVGGLILPQAMARPEVRVAVERLQPGGSLRFRGALHVGMRRFGARKGLVLVGDPSEAATDELLAQAVAARIQRTPLRAVLAGDACPRTERMLMALECPLEVSPSMAARDDRAAQIQRVDGFERAADGSSDGEDGAAYRAGVATLALELDAALGEDVACIWCADPVLAASVQAGFEAMGSPRRAVAPDDVGRADAAMRAAFTDALRVGLSATDAAVLAAAPTDRPVCVVLGS